MISLKFYLRLIFKYEDVIMALYSLREHENKRRAEVTHLGLEILGIPAQMLMVFASLLVTLDSDFQFRRKFHFVMLPVD